jgi:hypothetical protein
MVIDRAAAMLVDVDHVRWPVANLVSYLNEAMREIVMFRPDAFAITTTHHLEPGARHDVPAKYVAIHSIEESVRCATDVRSVTEADYKYYRLLSPVRQPMASAANPARTYHVKTYTKHPFDDRVFYVEPPVPAGHRAQVIASFVAEPPMFTSGDVAKHLPMKTGFEAQLLDWIMSRALAVDSENAAARAQAKEHLDAFRKALELKDKSTARQHNGGFEPTMDQAKTYRASR